MNIGPLFGERPADPDPIPAKGIGETDRVKPNIVDIDGHAALRCFPVSIWERSDRRDHPASMTPQDARCLHASSAPWIAQHDRAGLAGSKVAGTIGKPHQAGRAASQGSTSH